MYKFKSKGNIYIEYSIVFLVVFILFVLSLKLISKSITEVFLKEYLQGNTIKVSVSGLIIEKKGIYGGSKSSPVIVDLEGNKVAIDVGYLCFNEIPLISPSLTSEGNYYGANTLRYYAEVLTSVEHGVSGYELTRDDSKYLKVMIDTLYGMAGLIDQISSYEGKRSDLTMPNEKVFLKPLSFQAISEEDYIINDFTIYPGKKLIPLQFTKKDYKLLESMRMLYLPAMRLDDGTYIFLWLVLSDSDKDGKKELYTISRSQKNYTTLNKSVINDVNLLKSINREEYMGSKLDYRQYCLLNIFNSYSKTFLQLCSDDVSKYIVSRLGDEVNNLVSGFSCLAVDSRIKVSLNPENKVILNFPEEVSKNIIDIKSIKQGK